MSYMNPEELASEARRAAWMARMRGTLIAGGMWQKHAGDVSQRLSCCRWPQGAGELLRLIAEIPEAGEW